MSTLGIIAGSVLGRVVVGKILPNIGRLGSIEPGRYPHPIYGPIVIPKTPSLKPGDPNVPPPPKVQITLAGFLGGVALAAWLYDRSKQKEALSYIPGPEPPDPVEECLLNYGWNLGDIRRLKASIDAKAGTGEAFTADENRILDHIEGCLDIVEQQYGSMETAGLTPCPCSGTGNGETESPAPAGDLSGIGYDPELFKVARGQVVLTVQDPAKAEDLLLRCLERRGWKPQRVQEMQERIAEKMTPGLFTQEPEKLTGGEIMLQEAIDECLKQLSARGRSGEQMRLLGDMCGVKMECAEYKQVPAKSPRFKVKEVSRCARFQKTVGAPCITESPPRLEGISGDILTCSAWAKNEKGQWKCAEYMTTCEPGVAPREEKPEISPTEEYKKEWERAKRKAYQVKAEKVEAGTFDPVHERILKLIEEGNRDQEALEMESGISHKEMNVILNDMVVKDLVVPRQSGMYSAKYRIVPKKEIKAEVDPWMTNAPFTDQEQSYANMYTHFPLDWNKEFAKQVGNTENVTRKRLREFGVDELPPELFQALERYRKAVYEGYKAKWKVTAYFPPVSVVGPARYPVHRRGKAEARERKITESIKRARKKVDTLANRAIKGKVPKITIGQYLDVAATNSRIAFGKQYAMLEMQDKPHLSAFAHVFRKEGRELHRQLVEEAMKQGKQVLWAAVKDYPELQDYGRIIDKPTGIEMKISKKKGMGYVVTPRERKHGMKLVYLFRRKGQRKPRAISKDSFHYWENRPHEADVYATYAYSADHARELIQKGEVKPYTGEGDVYKPEEAHIATEKGHIKPLYTMMHSELVDSPFFTSAELPPFMTWMIEKSRVDEHGYQREFRGKLPYRMRKNLYNWLLRHEDGVKSGRHEGQFSMELPEGKLSFYLPEDVYAQTRLWIDRFSIWKQAVGEAMREDKRIRSDVVEEYRNFAEQTRRMLEERPNVPEAPQMRKEAEEMEANLRVYDEAQERWQRMREEARERVREAIRKPEEAERKPEPRKPRPILTIPKREEKIIEPEQLRLFGRVLRVGGV